MLKPYRDFKRVWIEISTDANHGGPGWEFGKCLWSPVTNKSGARRYQVMEQPKPGNCVLHFRKEPDDETKLAGWSLIKASAQRVTETPPLAGAWAGESQYYRTEITGYAPFEYPVPLRTLLEDYADLIRIEIEEDRPKFYPFTTSNQFIRTVQGIYLAECTPKLFKLLDEILTFSTIASLSGIDEEGLHHEFAESRGRAKETRSFIRNPRLIALAKQRAEGKCELCGLNAVAKFGKLGQRILECHHLIPLSERDGESTSTTLEEVMVLCANCHRMIHSQKPALKPEQLNAALELGA